MSARTRDVARKRCLAKRLRIDERGRAIYNRVAAGDFIMVWEGMVLDVWLARHRLPIPQPQWPIFDGADFLQIDGEEGDSGFDFEEYIDEECQEFEPGEDTSTL
jgi:hypothetical protein